jgi:predicted O-methyltransferase YrrM
VGATDQAMFAQDESATYDLIFIDAHHFYESVRNDTQLVLPLLSPAGIIVWHDYANWGYFSGQNGVPEYWGELAPSCRLARARKHFGDPLAELDFRRRKRALPFSHARSGERDCRRPLAVQFAARLNFRG